MNGTFDSFKIPRGRHGLPREYVRENQKWRLMAATLDLLAQEPCLNLTSHKVAKRAAISTQTFYAHFDSLDDCLLSTFEAGAAHLQSLVNSGREEAEDRPRGRIRKATESVCGLLSREPSFGRLLSLEVRAVAPALAEPYRRFIERTAEDLQWVAGATTKAPQSASPRARLLAQATWGLMANGSARPSASTAEQLADLLTAALTERRDSTR